MKKSADEPEELKESTDAVVDTKEKLVKNNLEYTDIERKLDEARGEQAGFQRLLKRANDAVTRETQSKVDAKNQWVKNMVVYAQKEKGMKKEGAVETEKHLKHLKQKNG